MPTRTTGQTPGQFFEKQNHRTELGRRERPAPTLVAGVGGGLVGSGHSDSFDLTSDAVWEESSPAGSLVVSGGTFAPNQPARWRFDLQLLVGDPGGFPREFDAMPPAALGRARLVLPGSFSVLLPPGSDVRWYASPDTAGSYSLVTLSVVASYTAADVGGLAPASPLFFDVVDPAAYAGSQLAWSLVGTPL